MNNTKSMPLQEWIREKKLELDLYEQFWCQFMENGQNSLGTAAKPAFWEERFRWFFENDREMLLIAASMTRSEHRALFFGYDDGVSVPRLLQLGVLEQTSGPKPSKPYTVTELGEKIIALLTAYARIQPEFERISSRHYTMPTTGPLRRE